MQIAHCKHCEYSCSLRGIYGHVRFRHGIDPTTNDFTVSQEENPVSDVYPVSAHVYPTKPSVAFPRQNVTEDLLLSKRNEVEMKKLDLELQRLEKGNTNTDPFTMLLKMQDDHNKEMREMQNENFETRMEILRLQSGSDDGDFTESLLKSFLPYIPQLLAQRQNNETNKLPEVVANQSTTSKPENMDLQKVPKEYIDLIKSGKLSVHDAWRQYQIAVKLGKAPKIVKKKFVEEFEKIKNS